MAIAAPARSIVAFTIAPAIVVAFDRGGLVPAGPLRVAVSSTLLLCLGAFAFAGQPPAGSDTPRPFRLVGLGLLVCLAISSLLGEDRWHALVGTPDRRFGWLTWALTVAMFAVGLRLRDQLRAIVRGASLAGLLVGVVALVELAGRHPAGATDAGARWSGLFGQPAYLATASSLFGCLAIGLATDRSATTSWRLVGWLSALGCTLGVVGSGTRGPLIGLGVSAALVVWVRLTTGKQHKLVAVAAAVVGALAIRFASTTGRSFSRIDEWAIGWRAFSRAPIFGYGPEGYRVVFGRVVTADYQRSYGSSAYTDRAHMGLLDLAIIGGVASLAVFLAGLWIVGHTVFRNRHRLSTTQLGLVAALVAHFIAQQALFPIASIEPLAWLYAGLLMSTLSPVSTDRRHKSVGRSAAFAVAAVVAFVAGLAETVAERRLATEAATNLIDSQIIVDAVALRPDSIRIRYAAAQLLSRNESLLDLDAALEQLEAAQTWSPLDPAINQRYVELLNLRATRSGIGSDADAAWEAARDLVAERPLDARALRAASTAASLAGDAPSASMLDAAADAVEKEFPDD